MYQANTIQNEATVSFIEIKPKAKGINKDEEYNSPERYINLKSVSTEQYSFKINKAKTERNIGGN